MPLNLKHNTVCPITGIELPEVPSYAKPVIACTGYRIAKQGHRNNPNPLHEHCGGCGWVHEHEEYENLGEHRSPQAALRAAGLRRGHVGFIYQRGGTYKPIYVCAGPCCRNAGETAEWIAGRREGDWGHNTTWAIADPQEAEAYDRYWESYERRYASAAALGL